MGASIFLKFPSGTYIKESNMTVLAVDNDGDTIRSMRYKVRRECCGAIEIMTHMNVRVKKTRKVKMCRVCGPMDGAIKAIKARGQKVSGAVINKLKKRAAWKDRLYRDDFGGKDFPGWPVPDVQLPRGWMPR